MRVQLTGQASLSIAEAQVFGAVAAFHTPVLAAIDAQQTPVNSVVSVFPAASDPDGNPLTFTALGLPPGSASMPTAARFGGTANTGGVFNVTVTATNGGGLSASTSFSWVVLAPIPQVVSLPAPVAASGGTVNYSPSVSDGAPSLYSWDFGDGSADTAFVATPGGESHLHGGGRL